MADFNISNSSPQTSPPPPPPPPPEPPENQHSLSDQINIATRAVHSQLNKLILVRLPLALPPYTENPSIYVSGILHIAPIYITFETLWQSIIDAPNLPICLEETRIPHDRDELEPCDSDCLLPNNHNPHTTNPDPISLKPKVCSRTQSLLAHLHLPGLLRAGRIRADVRTLTGTPEHKIDEQLKRISSQGQLADFIAHTEQSVKKNPHVLLAYAWVLYMALFSGGRYLRAALKSAGGFEDFWRRDPSPIRPYASTRDPYSAQSPIEEFPNEEIRVSTRPQSGLHCHQMMQKQGLSFFDFAGDVDGEDIKREFKRRIAEAEVLLTDGERADVIEEAQAIFSFMIMMISELDSVCGTKNEDLETAKSTQTLKPHLPHKPLNRSRSSVTLTQERLSRARDDSSSDEDQQLGRSPSFLASVIVSPMAKLVRFKDGLPGGAILPLARNSSKRFPEPMLSQQDVQSEDTGSTLLGLMTLGGPIVALAAVFATWYYVG